MSENQDTLLDNAASSLGSIAESLSATGNLTPEALFARCGYSAGTVDLFYAELKRLISDQRVREVRDKHNISLEIIENENK